MRQTLLAAALLCAAAAAFLFVRSVPPPPAAADAPVTKDAPPVKPGPEIGLDYRALIREQARLIAEGKRDKAVEQLDTHALTRETLTPADREELKKRFALVYATGGKLVGAEAAGYKRLSSRLIRVFGVAHFERFAVVLAYNVVRNAEG
jgi:hypothetical protein